jgi:hypothetical protein
MTIVTTRTAINQEVFPQERVDQTTPVQLKDPIHTFEMIHVRHEYLLVKVDHYVSMQIVHFVIHQGGMHVKMVSIVKILIVAAIIRMLEQNYARKVMNARISNVNFYILLRAYTNATQEINVVNGTAKRYIHKIVRNLAFISNNVIIPPAFVYIHPIDNCARAERNALNSPAT